MITDIAVGSILAFLKELLGCILVEHPVLSSLPLLFPGTLYLLWKNIGLKKDNFVKYVVCRKCYALYLFDECTAYIEGELKSKLCPFVPFPFHTQRARRTPCGELLIKEVTLPSGARKLYPFKTYCYKPIKEIMQNSLMRPKFQTLCQKWKNRTFSEGVYSDIYDGQVWKEFCSENKNNFLTRNNSYGLMLNLDWFQPYEHVQYSVGVIYAVVLNLPRSCRFKLNNVMLIGVVPDMGGEPSINTFMRPIVDDLEVAWTTGHSMKTFTHPNETKQVKYALMCVGCDVPATRKLCGFLGHTATLGCSKCLKKFSGEIGRKDCSGFDKDLWRKRTLADHRRKQKVENTKTPTERQKLESIFGVRVSELNRLNYFDPIRMSIIDPMHNLFQGTSKKMIKIWNTFPLMTLKRFKKKSTMLIHHPI